VLTNPEPVTVRVWAFEPAGTLVGLMDETAGVGVVFPPPPPEPLDPDPEPPLPQPLTITAIESPKTNAVAASPMGRYFSLFSNQI
jgi:hypothetical protein